MDPSPLFSPESKYIELEARSEELKGGHEVGGAPRGQAHPAPSWVGCGPPGLDLLPGFFIISKKTFREVSGHSDNFCFCT